MASLRSLEKVQTCSSALFHKVNSSWIYDFRKVLNDSTSFFFLEDESSLNKTAKAIGPEQIMLESMVLEENIGEEFCRDGPQIVKQNMHQPLGSKRKQRETEEHGGRKTKDNNVKIGDEEVQEGKSTPPNACLRCSGCLRGKGCKKVYKWRRLHK